MIKDTDYISSCLEKKIDPHHFVIGLVDSNAINYTYYCICTKGK